MIYLVDEKRRVTVPGVAPKGHVSITSAGQKKWLVEEVSLPVRGKALSPEEVGLAASRSRKRIKLKISWEQLRKHTREL